MQPAFLIRIGRLLCPALAVAGVMGLPKTPSAKPPQVRFAEVESIFQAHCVRCHGEQTPAAGLALDSAPALLKGGSIRPGDSKNSLLIARILGQGGKPRMPMGFGPLNDRDVEAIRAWIDEGCPTDSGKPTVHWSFVKPVRPALPKVRMAAWVKNPIDAFVLARLEREHLSPSPEATRTTLLRRVILDLTGLPPTLAEIDSFLRDRSPNAYEKVVDRLLASPHYGERMALPWLDAARYADSNGFQMDGDTYQYVWRDWVVRAMNANMPFDRFTVLQLAGDLLPDASPNTTSGRDMLVATAFNRNHMLNGEGGAIPEEARNVALFDRVDTTATTWMGLTMGCARCHDHKYDPLSQRDYYSLMAFFNQVPESGVPDGGKFPYSVATPWIYAGSPAEMDRFRGLGAQSAAANQREFELEHSTTVRDAESKWLSHPVGASKAILDILSIDAGKRTPDQAKQVHEFFLDHRLDAHDAEIRKTAQLRTAQLEKLRSELPQVMVMSDRRPRQTYIYSRGNYDQHLSQVSPDTPASLPPMPARSPRNRLGLAEWIVSPDNPLTARVQVNRYWQSFFGRGLVRTPEDFGRQGEAPTHPDLLDWLATEFVRSGWDVKHIQRLIVTSATYRQTSVMTPALRRRDPDNRLLARGARFRLPSLLIRDVALSASGLLNPAIGGKPVYPYQPKGIWDGLNITDERDFSYPESKGSDLYRRSIYTFWRRTVAPGDMFDASTRQVCTVRFGQTSTPMHALTTLNDTAWVEAGRALAQRVMKDEADPARRMSEAFRLVCARSPDAGEMKILKRSLDRARAAFERDPKAAADFLGQGESPRDRRLDPVEHAAYASVCLAILNLDEALTRE